MLKMHLKLNAVKNYYDIWSCLESTKLLKEATTCTCISDLSCKTQAV